MCGLVLIALALVVPGTFAVCSLRTHVRICPCAGVQEVDEDGCLILHCSSQLGDQAVHYVAGALQMRHNQVCEQCVTEHACVSAQMLLSRFFLT